MGRLAALLLLMCLPACGSGRKPGDEGRATTSVSTGREAQASDGGVGEGGGTPSRAEPLAIFLEAAQSNLERPYPGSDPQAHRRYAEAGAALLDKDPAMLAGWKPSTIVAEVLARADDERARRALIAWAGQPAAQNHLPDILASMHGHPREEYASTCRAILADEALAGVIVDVLHTDGGLLREALGMGVKASLQAMAMELCAALPGEAGKALVRGIAQDRAASAPNPKTLAALRCAEGETRVEAEAEALSSLRIMALSALRDRALLSKVAADPTESALVRRWARRMSQGGPDRSKPGWEARLDARQRQAYEQSMMEFVPPVVSPCSTARPRPIFPGAGKLTPSAEAPPARAR